jgi:hypothetical protein
MTRLTLHLVSILLACFIFITAAPAAQAQYQKLPTDRWTWLELYWVDHDHIPESVSTYLDRVYPLFKNASGWHGVIVNLCWVIDYIALWQGDLDQRIPLYDMNVAGEWETLPESLKRRPPSADRFEYARWTYRDLKRLGDEFRKQAAERYGLKDFKFTTTLLGYDDHYLTPQPNWRTQHSEIYIHDSDLPSKLPSHPLAPLWKDTSSQWHYLHSLIPGAPLKADHRNYAAFPEGIPAGTPFYHFFAQQWGSLSKAAALDGLVFEDDLFGPPLYTNFGPWGDRGASDPAAMERWHQACASLVRELKQSNPKGLVVGYSSAVGGVADWRLGGTDLERIAQEGYLDAWMDQTWAGAWNEYWDSHRQGYTFQLAFLLTHAAQLANSKVRHYIVAGPTDGYEPWDELHTVPEKHQWEIWAYTHAAVKTPDGLKVPKGIVLEFPTRGKRIWTEEDVDFLANNINAATADALQMKSVRGPTLVYNRPYLDWLQHQHPDWMVKEFIDDYAGMLMKWQVPILSLTRIEWLPKVKSDLFVFQTPAHLDSQTTDAILTLYRSGEPVAFVSDPEWGIDKGLREILDPPCKTISQERELMGAWLKTRSQDITGGLSPSFELWQGEYQQSAAPRGRIVYKAGYCPDLIVDPGEGQHWLFWNPPYFSPHEFGDHGTMDWLIPSPEPYILAARSFLKLMSDTGRSPFDRSNPVSVPLAVHYWETAAGRFELLVGNLERALPGDSETPKSLILSLPRDWLQAAGNQLTASDLTSDQAFTAGRGAGGDWQVQLPVAPNGSNVWVFHGK